MTNRPILEYVGSNDNTSHEDLSHSLTHSVLLVTWDTIV